MKVLWKSILLAALTALILAAGAQSASANADLKLYGTTGNCKNPFPGGPCSENSTLVQLNPRTGAVIRVIGPIGYTVNGLAWDSRSEKLYASTAIGCGDPESVCPFHGLITINTRTGAGTPVNPVAINFGLTGDASPIHSITIDSRGRLVAWYDERPQPGVTDTFVEINKRTGVATEFPNTGLDTNQNGLSFNGRNQLWNIDTVRGQSSSVLTQTAYRLDPQTGKPIASVALTPPTMAALGDFNPTNDLYYGLSFTPFDPAQVTFIQVVDLRKGTVRTLGQTIDNLHTLAFVQN